MTFDTVNASALAVFPRLLQVWLPQGQVRGHEYVVGNVQGEPGDSLSINVQTGVWSDFASDEGGSDPVSLYAAVFGLEQGEACRRLGGELGLSAPGTAPVPAPAKEDNWQPVLPAPAPPPSSFVHRNLGHPSATWTYRSADGDPLFLVCRFETPKGKVILPYTYGTLNGAKGWHWKHPKPPRPLYGLERLAQKPDAPVLIVEGEKTVDAAGRAPFADHVAVTWPGGSNAVNKADWTPLKGRRVVIWPDADDAGKKAARAVAQAVLAGGADQVSKVEPPPEAPNGWDLADRLAGFQPSALRKLLDQAQVVGAGKSERAKTEIRRLASLPLIEYELERKKVAKDLGVRRTALDELRVDAIGDVHADDLRVPEVKPHAEEVDGDDLLDQIVQGLRRYVVMPPGAAEIVALWCLHTYVYDTWRITPRLHITAPQKGCGKSTLLDVMECLTQRPVKSENLTVAVFFRVVDKHRPTVLLDEADKQLGDSEDKRCALNAGHKRGARFFRCEGDNHKVKGFDVFAPVAIAGIGRLPDTLEDRSIKIALEKRKASETITDFREDRADDLRELASMAARWMHDHKQELQEADPEMPAGLFNRTADNWRALLAIAATAGGDWPEKARRIAMRACQVEDDPSVDVQLLADLRDMFEQEGDKLHSEFIVAKLVGMADRPWPEYGKGGKPITQNRLAEMLSKFTTKAGIPVRSKDIRVGDKVRRGYSREKLENSFSRYLGDQSATPLQPKESAAYSDFQSATPNPDVALRNGPKPAENLGCSGVALQNPPSGEKNKNDDDGDLEEREAIQAIDVLLEIPEFLRRT